MAYSDDLKSMRILVRDLETSCQVFRGINEEKEPNKVKDLYDDMEKWYTELNNLFTLYKSNPLSQPYKTELDEFLREINIYINNLRTILNNPNTLSTYNLASSLRTSVDKYSDLREKSIPNMY